MKAEPATEAGSSISEEPGLGNMTVDMVRAAIPPAFRGVEGMIRILPNWDAVPAAIAEAVAAAGGNGRRARGYHVPGADYVYLFANNLKSAEDARSVLAHELIGHYAMSLLIEGPVFKRALHSVGRMEGAKNPTILWVAREVDKSQDELGVEVRQEEILAYMVETGLHRKSHVLRRAVADLTRLIKQYLLERGWSAQWVRSLSEQEVYSLLRYAEREAKRDAAQRREAPREASALASPRQVDDVQWDDEAEDQPASPPRSHGRDALAGKTELQPASSDAESEQPWQRPSDQRPERSFFRLRKGTGNRHGPSFIGNGFVLESVAHLDDARDGDDAINGLPPGHAGFLEQRNDAYVMEARDDLGRTLARLTVQVSMDGRITAIHDLVVVSEFQDRGVGTRLVASIAASSKYPIDIVDITPENMGFWRGLGLARRSLLSHDGVRYGQLDWQTVAANAPRVQPDRAGAWPDALPGDVGQLHDAAPPGSGPSLLGRFSNLAPTETAPEAVFSRPASGTPAEVDAHPQASGASRMPQGVESIAEPLKTAFVTETPFNWEGIYKGRKVILENVVSIRVNYHRRSRTVLRKLRNQFNNTVRRKFLLDLVKDEAGKQMLRNAGFTVKQIATIAQGKVPYGYNVHHKLPLDDGGTNEFENLVLIRNPPEHYAITNHQKAVTHNVAVGETVVVDFPVPTTSIFPLKGNGNVSKKRVQSNKKGHKGR